MVASLSHALRFHLSNCDHVPKSRPVAMEQPGAQLTYGSAWWAPNGFAAIPTTALDPPHSAASPAVPALIGSGSPSDSFCSSLGASDGLNLRDSLKLTEVFVPILRQPAHHASIREQLADVPFGNRQMEIVDPVRLLE